MVIRLLLIISLLSFNIIASEPNKFVSKIFIREQLDVEMKSTRGWLRLFNSKERLKKSHISTTEFERYMVIKYFDNINKSNTNKYNKQINIGD